ncbi:CHASE4 domain-containing protein [Granulosicoccus antarcticus]|uniref:histidine kinase n=1 Tax=Granulosicoccus antarcticus IMCC3135 TaxID=1192854 RepID=A0A2Z2NZ33_9GAMM|nr:CHASE4 domain-containing protein [Granulosicoccus antarcticus]ASJ76573.1 Sensor protein FixL [Granulosicoccus antarcticus IMCC3135]
MSLNQKVAMIVVLVFALSGAASLVVQQRMIMPSFVSLERDTAEKDIQRVLEGIGRELNQIGPSVSDWASWTDTYQYANGEYPEYVADNLDLDSTMSALEINFMGLFKMDGSVLWNRGWNLDTNSLLDLGALTEGSLSPEHPLMQIASIESDVSGIINTAVAPLLVVAKPILTSDGKGPPAGVFIMGRFFNDAAITRLSEQTRLDVTLGTLSQAVKDSTAINTTGLVHNMPLLEERADEWLGSAQLRDLYGKPILAVQVSTPRHISSQGRSAVNMALLSLLVTGVFTMIVLWLALQRVLLKPLKVLADHAQQVGASDDLHTQLKLNRHDEIGALADNFDQMVENLALARRKIVDQSYRSGVAEMASGVLHNIGNAITPLMVKLENLAGEIRKSPKAEIRQAVTELENTTTPQDRRVDLSRFVELAGVELAELCERGLNDVNRAVSQVGNIRDILSDQERVSRSARVLEPVDVGSLISDAASTLIESGHDTLQVIIDASVSDCGYCSGARAALQQVINNILINAAEAMEAPDQQDGNLRISAMAKECDGKRCISYRFDDDGVGIEAAHWNDIFQRGFSTKNRDGSGYGLHWSANTLQALGGSLHLLQDDDHCGASFEMTLPVATPAGNSANDAETGAVFPATGTGN